MNINLRKTMTMMTSRLRRITLVVPDHTAVGSRGLLRSGDPLAPQKPSDPPLICLLLNGKAKGGRLVSALLKRHLWSVHQNVLERKKAQ
jgi:hypothetical protein